MNHKLAVEVNESTFEAIRQRAEAIGTSPAHVAAVALEVSFADRNGANLLTLRQQFERHFGEIDLGNPMGADNDQIDADLAAEYATPHED